MSSININSTQNGNGWRTQAMYTFGEVAQLSGVSTGTVKNWLFGYKVQDREVQPLFKPFDKQVPMVSFLNLIEIVVAAQFRKAEHCPFQTVRQAHINARELFKLDYPFAHLELKAIGRHIVRLIRGEQPDLSVQAMDAPQQWTLPGLVTDTIEQLVYEKELAARWFPKGTGVPIVVDPRISSGMPVVFGRGVTVKVIRKRFMAGQKISFIAQDFEIEEPIVEEIVRYAEQVAA